MGPLMRGDIRIRIRSGRRTSQSGVVEMNHNPDSGELCDLAQVASLLWNFLPLPGDTAYIGIYIGIDPQRPFLPPSDSKSLGVQSTSSIVLPSRISPALQSKAGPGSTGHANRGQPQGGLPEPVLGPAVLSCPWLPSGGPVQSLQPVHP